jgi:hypothetical protein
MGMTTTLRQAVRWHPPLMLFAAAMAGMALVSLGGLLFDDRTLTGEPIWLKPFKFSVSFVVYSATLGWLLSLLSTGRRAAGWAGTVIVVAGVAEMLVIVGQVVRGRRSHFNVATPLDAALWTAMGLTIVVLWVATLVIAVGLMRSRLGGTSVAWAIRLGVVIALAGMALGFLMTQPTAEQQAADIMTVAGAHSVGVPDGGPGLPVTSWSTTGGDLRIPHFIGMHALQALPLFALFLGARRFRLDEGRRLRLVWLFGGLYAAAVGLVTWQALRGQPLLSPDAVTLGAAGVLAAVAVAGTVTILRTPTAAEAPREPQETRQPLEIP